MTSVRVLPGFSGPDNLTYPTVTGLGIVEMTPSQRREMTRLMGTCPYCDENFGTDSGGMYPWGEYIMVECSCIYYAALEILATEKSTVE